MPGVWGTMPARTFPADDHAPSGYCRTLRLTSHTSTTSRRSSHDDTTRRRRTARRHRGAHAEPRQVSKRKDELSDDSSDTDAMGIDDDDPIDATLVGEPGRAGADHAAASTEPGDGDGTGDVGGSVTGDGGSHEGSRLHR